MSQELISRSPDLQRLRDEGYDLEIRGGFLLVKEVPYVNSRKQIAYGILVSNLKLAGDVTDKPDDHVAYFAGEHPCNLDGTEISGIKHQSEQRALLPNLVVNHSFSNKPSQGYPDYYAKMTRYVTIISAPAEAINDEVTARTYPVYEAAEAESVFRYVDTASSRAQITIATSKLERVGPVAIVGLGGTGSYILDLIAKTPVPEIHLFDGDQFSQHNAFRSPGATSVEELRAKPSKVTLLKDRYSAMRRKIVDHPYFIDSTNVQELSGMGFVFLSLDQGAAKRVVVEKLEELGIPFIDAGIGVELDGDSLLGLVRVTTSRADKRQHVKLRVPFQDGGDENEYSRNIQVADLNALNAALAVIKWKKVFGFYVDLEGEHNSTYTISGNELTNEDQP